MEGGKTSELTILGAILMAIGLLLAVPLMLTTFPMEQPPSSQTLHRAQRRPHAHINLVYLGTAEWGTAERAA